MDDKDNVVDLKFKAKDTETVLTLLPSYGGCSHDRLIIDEKLEQVECSDCGEKINPIYALINLARKESEFNIRVRRLHDEAAYLKSRRRFTCGGCGQKNDITVAVKYRTKT